MEMNTSQQIVDHSRKKEKNIFWKKYIFKINAN